MQLLIVEDERGTREGLKRHVDWSALGIDQVLLAENGQGAIPLLRREEVSLVICDVRMPRMDGIELLRLLRSQGNGIPFVFLSGYTDKAYLKAAIRYGAVDYIEKPVNLPDLIDAVSRGLTGASPAHTGRHKAPLLSQLPAGMMYEAVQPVLFTFPENHAGTRETLLDALRSALCAARLCALYDTDIPRGALTLLILRREDVFRPEALYRALARSGTVSAMILGERMAAGENLPGRVQAAVDTLLKRSDQSFMGGGRLYLHAPPPPIDALIEDTLCHLERIMHQGLTIMGDAVMTFGEQLARMDGLTAAEGKRAMRKLEEGLREMAVRAFGQDAPVWEPVAPVDSLIALARQIADRADSLARLTNRRRAGKAVQAALDYIHDHYRAPIKTGELARAAYVSPAYISRLFKEEMGLTIHQYIADLRLEKARHMLLNPQVTLADISRCVGVEDASYFSRLFKKTHKMSPSEYRERALIKP